MFWKEIKITCCDRAYWSCRAGVVWLLYSPAPTAESALWNGRGQAIREEGALGFGNDPFQCCPKALARAAGSPGTFVLHRHFSCVLAGRRCTGCLCPWSGTGRCACRPLLGDGEHAWLGLHTGEELWKKLPLSRDARGGERMVWWDSFASDCVFVQGFVADLDWERWRWFRACSELQPTTHPFKMFCLKTGDVNSILLQPSETRLECVWRAKGAGGICPPLLRHINNWKKARN